LVIADQSYRIRPSTLADAAAILALYQRVAAQGTGLARRPEEVTEDYVRHFLTRSLAAGVALVVEHTASGRLVAEIHTYASDLTIFAHVLGDLTVAVDVGLQNAGVGRQLFTALLATVREQHPHVQRVELLVRESNARAIALYEKLGFRREGRLEKRVAGPHGLEADIPMAWHAPA
jgi:putative acetyltransferase